MGRRAFPSGRVDQFQLRMPVGLRARIKVEAANNMRPMNSEICARLEASFNATISNIAAPIAAAINTEVERRVAERIQEIASRLSGGSNK